MRWEDQERGNWDVEALKQEFRERLYVNPPPAPAWSPELADAVARLLRCQTEGVGRVYAGCDDIGGQNRTDLALVVAAVLPEVGGK